MKCKCQPDMSTDYVGHHFKEENENGIRNYSPLSFLKKHWE